MVNRKQKEFKTSVGSPMLRKEIEEDLRRNADKFGDPVVLGELVFKLLEERENTNRILKTLLKRIEELELKVNKEPETKEEIMLPAKDEKILNLVKVNGKMTAETVQKELGYKGKNAASSRLNKLFSLGLVVKKQVGRIVYFLPK